MIQYALDVMYIGYMNPFWCSYKMKILIQFIERSIRLRSERVDFGGFVSGENRGNNSRQSRL